MQSGSSIDISGTLYMRSGYDETSTPTYRTGLLTAGNITANEINMYSGGGININGSLTSTGSSTHLYAGLFSAGILTVSGNISGLTNAELDNQRGSIAQISGTVSAQTGYVTFRNNYATAPSGSFIAINNIVSNGTSTTVDSRGQILDNNGSATNITSDNTISLTSYGGTSTGGIAISTDTAGTFSSLNAVVSSNATYGGVNIRHQGDTPSSVTLTDSSTYTPNNFVEIRANGSIGAGNFTGNNIHLTANGNITIGGGMTFSANPDELTFVAGGSIYVSSGLSASKLGMAAGANTSALNSGEFDNIAFEQAIQKIYDGYYQPVMNGNLTVSGATITASQTLGVAGYDINLTSGSLNANSGSAYLYAGNNITLNGFGITAFDDVKIRLVNPSSILTLGPVATSNQAWIWAKSPDTVYLDFLGRSGGGVVIRGVETTQTTESQYGFFYTASKIPALPGTGMQITYGAQNNAVTAAILNEISASSEEGGTVVSESLAELDTLASSGVGGDDPIIGGSEGEFAANEGTGEEGAGADKADSDEKDKEKGRKRFGQCKG